MTRRWVTRVALTAACVLAIVVVAGASIEGLMRYRAARDYPAPGRLVDVGGRRLQIDCRGSGSPTVVLESGLDNLGSLSWAAVHDSLARTTRVCAYSRAGMLWSDPRQRRSMRGRSPGICTRRSPRVARRRRGSWSAIH